MSNFHPSETTVYDMKNHLIENGFKCRFEGLGNHSQRIYVEDPFGGTFETNSTNMFFDMFERLVYIKELPEPDFNYWPEIEINTGLHTIRI